MNDTTLKVSFITFISHGIENYFPRVWGTDIPDAFFFVQIYWDTLFLLGRLHVTNPPIRLLCPSVCPSTFSFLDSN